MGAAAQAEGLRLNELIAALSLAIDLGTGQPAGHALDTCRLSMAVADELALDARTAADVYYVALLRFLGCTADAPQMARYAGGDNGALLSAMAPVYMGGTGDAVRVLVRSVGRGQPPPTRARLLVEALVDAGSEASHCEVGARLAARLGLGAGVVEALAHAYERWDGRGVPDGLAGEAVPVPVRVVAVARDAVLWQRLSGADGAMEVLLRRRGRAYDPAVVDAVSAVGLAEPDDSVWDVVLEAEPEPVCRTGGVALETALAAAGDFADLRSVWTRGRSSRLAGTARAAGRLCGLPGSEVTALGRAALVADLGAVGLPAALWARTGPLGTEARERVRLHPYLSERVLGRCRALRPVAVLAGAHHERLDGSGYHRGSGAAELAGAARLLAAADVWTALREDRPHRRALPPAEARDTLRMEVDDGRLDATAVEALLAVDGLGGDRRRIPRPAGLSDRELEVLRLVARGLTNREVAARLWLSPKTVGHHIDHIYAKIGVRTRPGAALFAMEHRLLDE